MSAPSEHPDRIHTHTVYSHPGLSSTLFLPPTSAGSSAQSLNPVAVVTLPLYTMAWWLHNVSLPVQFVAHTTAEWAGSTPRRPPTLLYMLMKSLASPGSEVQRDCPLSFLWLNCADNSSQMLIFMGLHWLKKLVHQNSHEKCMKLKICLFH